MSKHMEKLRKNKEDKVSRDTTPVCVCVCVCWTAVLWTVIVSCRLCLGPGGLKQPPPPHLGISTRLTCPGLRMPLTNLPREADIYILPQQASSPTLTQELETVVWCPEGFYNIPSSDPNLLCFYPHIIIQRQEVFYIRWC